MGNRPIETAEPVEPVGDPVGERLLEATAATQALTATVNRRAKRQLIANLIGATIIVLLIAGLAASVVAIVNQHRILDRQSCINGANDDRATGTRAFLAAEYQKVNNQYIGFKMLRDASTDGRANPKNAAADQAKALRGYDIMLEATKAYRDSAQILGRLKEQGVSINRHKDGTVTVTVPPGSLSAGCR